MMRECCDWGQDSDGVWSTECGHLFETIDDLPSKNGFVFCCYCGKPIVENAYDEDRIDD